MPRQIALFLTAVQFLTRVPVPTLSGFEPEWIAQSARYFPLVGVLVGAAGGVVFALMSSIASETVAAVVTVGAMILLTGAFHEDGLADTADGLGGGQTPSRRLEIMKDSRIGTYGALALVFAVAVKIASLADASVGLAVAALIAAHGAGRAAAVVVMGRWPYAGDPGHAKVKPVAQGVTRVDERIALAFGTLALVPALLLAPGAAVLALGAASILAGLMARSARRLISGWVGDTLGAVEQVFEVTFLTLMIAVAAS